MDISHKTTPDLTADTAVDLVDTRFLESLLGYNTRRATLVIIGAFLERMEQFNLRPVDFSVASLIVHNPGITSRQLCATLGLLPPNLVGLINTLEKRGLITRRPHPNDGRAMGLHPTPAGIALMQVAEQEAFDVEAQAASTLTATERKTLIRLLQKVYLTST
ncbi:MarR family transcriptional regulator [Curvibacter sp. CHRR-16]|uniref:MarR family winged helix-turn-helix transcriptional regulator n=1 Tax=Curvibacter sp. CHRR-16 TaxID=2835872 RepID=UPI001BD92075|nr:MarR family transcriptional regulator [Curvibacter sp. CHRR-16]MBT0568847.1 MarR family transcriptional regulator [Curvibacter sp. CHRR-16]